jgi:ABC-type phosphate transport system ATPase subunit
MTTIELSKMIQDAFGASSETANEIKFIRQRLGSQANMLDKVIKDLVKHQGLIEALSMRVREAEDLATGQRDRLVMATTLTRPENKAVFIANEINVAKPEILAEMIGYMTQEKKDRLLKLLTHPG